MSRVVLSLQARDDLQRLFDFLAAFDEAVAHRGIDAIDDGLFQLEQAPNSGTPVPDRPYIRKLVIDFGSRGYLIFHKRYEGSDTTVALAILHQKEQYNSKSIGFASE